MKLSRGGKKLCISLSIYLFPLLAYQQCHASLDSIAGIHSPKWGRRPRLHVAGRWLVVAYGGLCPQAEVIFFAYHHVPLASINWLDSLHSTQWLTRTPPLILRPPFPSFGVSVMK